MYDHFADDTTLSAMAADVNMAVDELQEATDNFSILINSSKWNADPIWKIS